MRFPKTVLRIEELDVEVTRRSARSIRIVVTPPDGLVRVSAPLFLGEEAIRASLVKRLVWIRKHRARMAAMRKSPRLEFVEGETLRFLGRDHVIRGLHTKGRQTVRLLAAEGRVELRTREGSDREARAKLVDAWYRAELGEILPPLIRKWEAFLGVRVVEWGLRRMRSRWGSCNPASGRISLNLELALRPEACLEYVLVHEMAHLLEPGHGPAFKAIMDRALPDWKRLKKILAEEALPRE